MLRHCFPILLSIALVFASCKDGATKGPETGNTPKTVSYEEPWRPQYHFSPPSNWMNDPNGLVFHEGIYHLFYQHHPEDIVWGPMHWGHATSKDLVHWEQRPIALFPDDNGTIFSGSAVVDTANTSGFGSLDNPPMVAIFTYHDHEKEAAGTNDFQTQGIAYSLDNGTTWTKYEKNPVIGNTDTRDFRDPKVFWNEQTQAWTMLLVAGDHLQIWNSPDLKNWKKGSEFGKDKGAHGGVWECPDLFPLPVGASGERKWVLLISINPGAPNGGSGTQYFVGDFDGERFTTAQEGAKWVDWGRDNYAGVTYNHTPDGERVFIGWINNWDYAQKTPTTAWRSAMTVARNLSLDYSGEDYYLKSYPVQQFNDIVESGVAHGTLDFTKEGDSKSYALEAKDQTEIRFNTVKPQLELVLNNAKGEAFKIVLDTEGRKVTVDRSGSGKVAFDPSFAPGLQEMPMPFLPDTAVEVRILVDRGSVTFFIDGGRYVMTNQVFPTQAYDTVVFTSQKEGAVLADLKISPISRIW